MFFCKGMMKIYFSLKDSNAGLIGIVAKAAAAGRRADVAVRFMISDASQRLWDSSM